MDAMIFRIQWGLILISCFVVPGAIAAEPASKPAAKDPVTTTNAPAIMAAEPIHDFGTTWAGGPLQHSFTIKNAGKAPLEIARIVPACGCTTVGEYPKRLEAGQSGQFSFTMDSLKLQGNYSKTISIHSNDPNTPELKLTLKGESKHYIQVTPSAASFGKITGNKPVNRTVTLKNNTEVPLKLELRPPEGSKFNYELAEMEPGQLFELRVLIAPPFSPGLLREKVTLTTNIEALKTITVDSIATIPEQLEVIPDAITINTSAASSSKVAAARTLTFTNNSERPIKLLETLVDDPAIKLGVEEQEPGKRYNISVLIPAGYAPPANGRTVVLRIDDPEKPFLLVPIRSTTAPDKPSTQPAPATARKPNLVGKPAPEFKLTTVKGTVLDKTQLSGKVTVLNFFAPNCGFCKKQMPRVETLRPAYEAKGVQFVHVSETMGKKVYTGEEIKSLLDGLKVEAEWAIDNDNAAGKLFQASGFPTMIIIGKSGKIEAVNAGNSADLETRVKSQLDLVLSQVAASGSE